MNSSNTQRSRQPEDQSQSRNSLDVTATAGPSSYCQERKMECHGRPCQHCAKDRVDCVEPGGSDNQQPNQLKRKAGELEQGQRVLASLMSSLRNSDDSQTLSLLNLIRSNAPLQELKAFTEEQLSQRRSSELADARLGIQRLQEPKYKITRRRVLDVRQLCDEPTFRVPAKPWTTVTDDDGLVSHFLSLYLTWYHPCFPWIDQDVFINEMRTGDLNSEYCSPFLVNALLAEGCAYSDYAEAYADPSDLSSRGIHFYTEAKRCLELEKRESTIATLQGLEVLSFCSFLLGKDRRGWMYQGQLELAAKDFTRTHPPTTPGTLGKCAGFTLWGLYNTTMASAMAYHKAPLVATPPHKRPPSSHEQDGDGDIWHPYPYHTEGVKTHSACHFSHLCELTLAINDWCSELFGSDEKPAYGKVMSMTKSAYERLQAWEKGLPSCLHVNDNVPVVPQVLVLHMYYHNILITLHGFSRTKEAEAEAGESPISSNTSKRATAIRLSSARRIAQLIDHHRSLWGLNIFSAANTQWITISLFTLLEDLDDPRNRHAFIALAIAAKAASRRWALDKAMLRAVQLTARQMAVSLPPETDALFTDFESLWTAQDRESLSSLYPNFAVSMGAVKDEAVELDKFLAKWDALDISDEK